MRINLQLQTSDFVDVESEVCNCKLIRINNQVLLDDGNRQAWDPCPRERGPRTSIPCPHAVLVLVP